MVPVRVIENKSTAYKEVRKLLLGGEVHPGQRLSHRSLAKDLGLSRSPVREALLQLEAEGFIEHRHHQRNLFGWFSHRPIPPASACCGVIPLVYSTNAG